MHSNTHKTNAKHPFSLNAFCLTFLNSVTIAKNVFDLKFALYL